MLTHPIELTQVPNTAAVLQLNCRRSPPVLLSLFNDENINNFLCLALQEPPINTHTNRPHEQSGWLLVCHQPTSLQEDSRSRSCIYINQRLKPTVQPIDSRSRDVTACTVKIGNLETLLVNVYNQPGTFEGFEAVEITLRSLTSQFLLLPTILVTDSNLHSSIWNPTTYQSHDKAADRLVDVMTRWSLYLRSPKGVTTYDAKHDMTSGTTIDLVWVNQQADDLLVACLVDTENTLNHHSDHKAVVTVINVNCDDGPSS